MEQQQSQEMEIRKRTASKKTTPIDRLRELADQALARHGQSLEEAVKDLAKEVRRNKALYKAVLDPLLEAAIYKLVAERRRGARGEIWVAPNYEIGGRGERAKVGAQGNALMFFALPHGTLLRDATRAEVADAAEFYRKQGADMLTKARWLAMIEQAIPEGKTVGRALTEDALRKFREEALHGKG